jgi:7-cyano-7-deazaguanine reductase
MNEKHKSLTHLKRGHTQYPDSPDRSLLEAFNNANPDRDYMVTFDCPEFTSVCPITGQPDFGHITIQYIPDGKCLESKSLKIYLFSFRNQGAFHEDVVNRIMTDIVDTIRPRQIKVKGDFNPRGGISISVEASSP